jgi:transposase
MRRLGAGQAHHPRRGFGRDWRFAGLARLVTQQLAWLARHPRWAFHFTPTSASWLNAVENVFSKMTRQRIRRGVFHSIVDLQNAINAYLAEHNASPKPFVWIKSAEVILAKLDRLPVISL